MTYLYELKITDDSGVTFLKDTDLKYLKSEKRRRENMGMKCVILRVE